MKIVFLIFFIISLILYASSLRCFGGLNEYFSDESLLKIENTHYVCGNNSDWDEIIIEDGEWFCMKGVQSQLDQTILEYGCAKGCFSTSSTFNDVTKTLYCCSTNFCNNSLSFIRFKPNKLIILMIFLIIALNSL